MPIETVEVPWPLLLLAPNPAEQALDLLNKLEEHSLAEQDINPRVQDGVDRGNSNGLEIRVLLYLHLHWGLVELVNKHLHLKEQ